MKQGDQFQTSFCFFKKALYERKATSLQLSFNIMRQSSTWHTIKTSCIKLQAIDLEICSTLSFQKRVQEQFLYHILCMIFQQKCFSCYILLTEQISLSNYVYFLRYWTIYVLQLFVNQGVASKILTLTLYFESSCFYT